MNILTNEKKNGEILMIVFMFTNKLLSFHFAIVKERKQKRDRERKKKNV